MTKQELDEIRARAETVLRLSYITGMSSSEGALVLLDVLEKDIPKLLDDVERLQEASHRDLCNLRFLRSQLHAAASCDGFFDGIFDEGVYDGIFDNAAPWPGELE